MGCSTPKLSTPEPWTPNLSNDLELKAWKLTEKDWKYIEIFTDNWSQELKNTQKEEMYLENLNDLMIKNNKKKSKKTK